MHQPPHYGLTIALRGFHAARGRFDGPARLSDEEEDVILPLVEALWWAQSVDEAFREDLQLSDYESYRNRHTDGRVISGVRYARNRCGHERALIVRNHQGVVPPLTPPTTLSEFVWRPVSELPAPGRPDPGAQQVYEKHLVDRPARHTLEAVGRWFAHAQNYWAVAPTWR